jgi:hypothetical protein
MERLGRFADQTTPVFTDLGVAAPGINQAFTHIPAFSNSSSTFFQNLGKTSKQSGPALVATKPLLNRLRALGNAGKPFTGNLAELLASLRDTGGLERILDFIFLGTGSANGYDALGHFLRAEGVGTACLTYQIKAISLCGRQLFDTRGSETPSEGSSGKVASINPATTGLVMARTLAVINGATVAQALAKYPGSAPTAREISGSGSAGGSQSAAQPVGGSTAGTTYYAPSAEGSSAGGMLLNYLLGN